MEDSRGWLTQKVKRLASRVLNHSGHPEHERERLFVENGSKLLEELISSCKDKCRCNLIPSFSAKQVLEATNYFKSHSCYDDDYKSYFKSHRDDDDDYKWYKGNDYEWYRGSLNDRPVLIKKYVGEFNENGAYRDIAIGSQMSSHKNALKLLGCCLESSAPALVFEDAENGPFSNTGGIDFNGSSLSWNTRLRVAKEIANAITYLHTAFARPTIHKDIKPSNIFLDKDYVPKLSGFNRSVTIPEGETQVEDSFLHGTYGFDDPVYLKTSIVTAHYDVYSFGVFLLILLTGQRAFDSNRPEDERRISNYVVKMVEQERFKDTVDPIILEGEGGVNPLKELQLKAFLKLALSCVRDKKEERPLMIDVAKELVKIEKSTY